MSLLRLALLSHRRLLPSVQTSSQLRLFASAINGKKGGRNNGTLSSKPDITTKVDVQPKQTTPVLISRQFQSSSRNQNTGGSSKPPASSSINQFLWIGAAAAIILGGGAYIINHSKDEKSGKSPETPKKMAPPKKPKVPLTSAEIPKDVPYLLIGGGTASFAAFRAIKSHDPKAKVMVLSDEIETPYMRPPLSKELWLADETVNGKDLKSKAKVNSNKNDTETLKFKQWNGIERSLYYEPNDFYTHPSKLSNEPNGGVAIVRGYEVKKVDVENRIAILTDGTEIKYGKCLIATGSSPRNLPVFENASSKLKERISLFKTIEDYGSLKKYVDQSESVAIIGGGFLGSELACALAKYGEDKNLKVYQVFHEKGNMGKVLPEFLSEWTTERVREEGVDVIPNTEVQTVDLVNDQVKLFLKNGQSIVCDHVVVAVGSTPNTTLGKESGLEIETNHGGYLVNAELSARNNLYVAGDAACFYDPRLGRRRVEHHDHAVVSGRLAGENMVGLSKPYTHQSMFWSDLGPRVGYEALGIIDSSLPTVSVFVKKTPETVTSQSDDTKPSAVTPSVKAADPSDDQDDFSKGVVFYLRDEKIVGIVLWNVFNRINTARAVLSQDKKYDDLNEVAKLFDIHM
ncbi:apoptosis-inducing factor 1, mitochondrial-like [Sitodiplosis mosellana]|uniref:apoptosis-inducing factor 1, mitochondrial-like n=1 Tax=Sitodiplosis mosellana TaxID=263140 RepID=UPI002443CD80|nr:apoptosis-inducing factor 1, mitochondrial-like [Sitodiplosis mosellana]XP_055312518.1 apoptosis-inducing factor 1, mitochondrial-like [Sitodiplosis mosellana]